VLQKTKKECVAAMAMRKNEKGRKEKPKIDQIIDIEVG
jgi:hypothetical protein